MHLVSRLAKEGSLAAAACAVLCQGFHIASALSISGRSACCSGISPASIHDRPEQGVPPLDLAQPVVHLGEDHIMNDAAPHVN